MRNPFISALLLFLITFTCTAQSEGKIIRIDNFKSQFVQSRTIEIWLPDAYFENSDQKFPVVYTHDGQNVFNDETSSSGVALNAHITAGKLIADETVTPFIIVAVWNTDKRFLEYFPDKASVHLSDHDLEEISEAWKIKEIKKGDLLGDEYLKFIVSELKPYIDKNYRTLPDAENTSITGGSMGGLISLYAICEYPEVFSHAACVSTHWPLLFDNGNMEPSDSVRAYLEGNLPDPATHRIYFDHGTATLDQYYEVHQKMVDHIMRAKGYTEGDNWITRKFEGAEHHEKSIKERMDVIFKFLHSRKEN
jgi:predicted alpha/beta superfamily hydrolase